MTRLSLYHRIILGILILWGILFTANLLVVRPIRALQRENFASSARYTDIISRVVHFQQNLADLEVALALSSSPGTGPRGDFPVARQAFTQSLNELELLIRRSHAGGPVPPPMAEGFLKGCEEMLNDLAKGKLSAESKDAALSTVSGLVRDAGKLNYYYRNQIREFEQVIVGKSTSVWAWFLGMTAATIFVALLLGVLIARHFTGPVYTLARQVNQSMEDDRKVEVKQAHPVDSLRNAVQSLLDEYDEMKEEFEASRERGEQSERLAVAGRVAIGLTHEIQEPLAALKHLIDNAGDENDGASSKLQKGLRDIERIEEFLEEFLDFAGAQKPRFELFDLNEIVNDAIQFIAAECEQRMVVIEKELGEFPHVMADDALLQEALVNVMHNAIEAMPNGGTLSVTTRLTLAGGPPPLSDTEGVEIFIADSGPGFPEESIEKIFDAFFSTKPKGTGLGMTIVRRVIELHGGRVRALNRDGGGALISAFLPLPSQEQQEALEQLEEALAPKISPKTS